MELEIINEDSILSLISNLSSQLTRKLFHNKADHATKKKEYFKTSFEILLNKRRCDICDHRSDYPLDELLSNTHYFVLCRNKSYLNKEIRDKITAYLDRLGDLARRDSDTLSLIKAVLRLILLLNDNLPNRKVKGILKYKEPCWFPPHHEWNKNLNQSSDLNFRSMMCIKENPDTQFPYNLKMKKSATWHEGVMNTLKNSSSESCSFLRPSSQTFMSQDEGFVTPDDFHREITPEPLRDTSLEPGWWCNWDVLSSPPSQYKTWESQWVLPVHRETEDVISSMEISYNARWAEAVLQRFTLMPPLQYFVEPDQLAKDIVCLLCGFPSSTFQLVQGNLFELTNGTYTKGVMPNELYKLTLPLIKFAELYRSIETFIYKNRNFDHIIPQAFFQTLQNYIFQLNSLIINNVGGESCHEMMNRLSMFIVKPLDHLQFLWNLIDSKGNASCHSILEKMYSSLPYIHDVELLCIVNVILLKCSYQYVSFFEKLINTGVCAEELMCQGTGSVSVEKVPYFLRSLADVINNSTKTLQLLHKDPKMSLLKSKVVANKPIKPKIEFIDAKEIVKQHYIKFMKEKEEERAEVAKKKSLQLKCIMEDIASKQKWKELEEIELEVKERKLHDRYDKLDEIKQKYIEDCKKKVEAKYNIVLRESDKKIAVAQWKLKRLAGENTRSEMILNENLENNSVREEFLNRGIDISEGNKDILVDPIEVKNIEIIRKEVEIVNEPLEPPNRHEDAFEIKRKMVEGSMLWDYNEVFSEVSQEKVDPVDGLRVYKETRSKALAIKKKIMSSELCMGILESSLISPGYEGLSPSKREQLEHDLTVFSLDDSRDSSHYFTAAHDFLEQKKRVLCAIELENKQMFHSGVLNFIEMRHVFLKSAETYLKKEVEVANRVMLEQVKEGFVKEVRWILDHYLLMDGVWGRKVAEGLVSLMRGTTQSLFEINRLLPARLALSTSHTPPPAYDPTDPSTLDFLMLTYRPSEPLNHFITERLLVKYNLNFFFLIKIEQSLWMLSEAYKFIRMKPSFPHGAQYNQIYLHIHIMNHFILTFKSFIFNAFERCWNKFCTVAEKVTSLDELHYKHISFLRNTQYFCLQNKKSANMREAVTKLLKHVFKYCETLRCGIVSFTPDGQLEHSLYRVLVENFKHFLTHARYLYVYTMRLVDMGHALADVFSDLRDMLGINDFYLTL